MMDLEPKTASEPERADPVERLAAAWLKAYDGNTRSAYERDLRSFGEWLVERDLHPLEVSRAVVDEYRNELSAIRKPASLKLTCLSVSPWFLICRSTRWSRAIASFSSSV